MKISIVGTGYVGLVTGASLSAIGHKVKIIGRDSSKTKKINSGKSPFYEPGLDEIIRQGLDKELLHATTNFDESVNDSQAIILAVGTPTVKNKIDLSAIKNATKQIGQAIKGTESYKVIAVKSTVVPMTTEKVVGPIVEKVSGLKIGEFGLCMIPEFLREGQAVEDALDPDRIVIGAIDEKSANSVLNVYRKIKSPKLITNLRTAEMIKYASNSLFATLISYSNEIARICEGVGSIDAHDVWEGVHLDKRLSPKVGRKRIKPGVTSFILSGCGYGGSCFPKDTKALANFAKSIKVDAKIIKNVIEVNKSQPRRMVEILKNTVGELKNKKIAILGLSFKPDTDDLRESPALEIIRNLMEEKAKIFAHDPTVKMKKGELLDLNFEISESIKDALEKAHAALLITSWNHYKNIKPSQLKKLMLNPVIIDGRRILSKKDFLNAGVIYKGIGLN